MVRCSDIQRLESDIDSLRDNVRWLTERVYALEQASRGVTERPAAKPVERPAPPLRVEPVREVAVEPAWPEPAPAVFSASTAYSLGGTVQPPRAVNIPSCGAHVPLAFAGLALLAITGAGAIVASGFKALSTLDELNFSK